MNKPYTLALALLMCFSLHAQEDDFQRACQLYHNGLYAQSMDLLQTLPGVGKDAMVDGYVVLCAQKQKTDGYEQLMEAYFRRYSSCSLCVDIRKERALDLFDRGEYQQALDMFNSLSSSDYSQKDLPEYLFKKGYCLYMLDNPYPAMFEFDKVDRMMLNDYSAPAQYVSGYICYGNKEFERALGYFGKSVRDERLSAISNYYIINCHYELKDYDYVISEGVRMFEQEKTPAERKAHLARIISESYLVKDNKQMARKFYDDASDDSEKSRADYFYAGSLLYATGEYQDAIDNYMRMPEKTDSLGQIAWYQTALSYLGIKNKVAALDAFKNATALPFDARMTEDAHFNYAKLAFDLNKDTSVFGDYMRRYADKVRGEKIYSYMALASLSDRDYQGAIDYYDRIDVLEGQEKNNYVHANYLRGAELLGNGSYRKSVQCMKAVTYYTDRTEVVNQLARYALGEAYYRDGKYDQACSQFNELYNNSALYGLEQGSALPYNVAYSYFQQADYINAARWYKIYMDEGGKSFYKDAMLRYADCFFARKEYSEAAVAYQAYVDRFYDLNDIYPYYQAAMCYGLVIDPKSRSKSVSKTNIAKKLEILGKVRLADGTAPYYPEAMLELGRTLHAQKENAKALEVFGELVAKAPAGVIPAQAMLEIGTLKRSSGDLDGALEAYKEVVGKMEFTGLADDALLAIESIYQANGQPQKYLDYLDSIGRGGTKTEEQKEDMFFNAAEQLYFADNYPKAMEAFKDFMRAYPGSVKLPSAWYYIGECYRFAGDKELACDAYAKAMENVSGAHLENALMQYAALNYSMDNFELAYAAYSRFASMGTSAAKKSVALAGAVRSAFKAKRYEDCVAASSSLPEDGSMSAAVTRELTMMRAKSLLALSRRDEAFAVLGQLAADPKSAEGAEAAFMLIQDSYDRGDFEEVKTRVYALSDSGTSQQYFLAKAFIVLGDSFAEQGKFKQAEATFRSIAEGYKDSAEINEELQIRLQKLGEK